MGGWGRDPRKQKDSCTTVKKRPKQKISRALALGVCYSITDTRFPYHIFIGKVVFICLRVSVNLVYKFQGKPGTTTVKHDFNPNGLTFHRGSPWVSISWLNLKANKDYFSYEYHQVPFHERVVTVIYFIQIEPKNGFETEKMKDGWISTPVPHVSS